ncbi:Dag7 protein [Gymnopus androsaceus JB14]|uniref:Dag7 protein n=1 Tax=Gymnopus androsaceus JB14 TaxID=1447944 RepID=A0A6A4ITG9_9AGAR|nr:Dag7 protein [Gymnopus androsaceus JB14]
MSFAKSVVLLLSAFTCVQAVATPHAIRNAHHHRAVAHRAAPTTENLTPIAIPAKKRDLRKRSLTKRCQARPSLSATSSSQALCSSNTHFSAGLGACGITNTDTDYICAVSEALFDIYPGYNGVNPNSNPVCGRQITASYQGKSVTVTVTDRCTGCDETSLDFSPSAFSTLADQSLGRIDITWEWAS